MKRNLLKNVCSAIAMVCCIFLACGVIAAAAQSSDPAIVDSGACGVSKLTYELYSDGTLRIYGKGAMDFVDPSSGSYSSSDVPWNWNRGKIKKVTIENGVTSIGVYAFWDCIGLTDVTIPDSVTEIEWSSFSGCIRLKNIHLPYGVTTIEYSAFDDCRSLTSIALPSSLTFLASSAFKNCISLTDVYYAGTESQWNDLRKYVNASDDSLKDVTIHYNAITCGENVYGVIENTGGFFETSCSLHLMGSGATYDYVEPYNAPWYGKRRTMQSVTIDAGVTRIGTNAFKDCAALKDVYYAGTEAQWNAVAIADGNDALKNAVIHYNS